MDAYWSVEQCCWLTCPPVDALATPWSVQWSVQVPQQRQPEPVPAEA